MEKWKVSSFAICLLFSLLVPAIQGWGFDGHFTVCRIAQSRLSKTAVSAVEDLLSKSGETELGNICIWADRVKFRYHWSSALHYVDTPDSLCSYQFSRDCKDENDVQGRCVAGAINNYTSQLLNYDATSSRRSQYNLTEALLFLSHFMGDIHQPLHVGFTSDRGGNTIDVHWYTRKQNLHHIWDSDVIDTAEERYYDGDVDRLVDAIGQNITTQWAKQVKGWETCGLNKTVCPDIYASESVKAACDWAYRGVTQGSVLEDDYFLSRKRIINLRLAQGGVRLAATLNRLFG